MFFSSPGFFTSFWIDFMEMTRYQLQGQCIYIHSSGLSGCVRMNLRLCESSFENVFAAGMLQNANNRAEAGCSSQLYALLKRSGKTPLCSIHSLIALWAKDCFIISTDIGESVNLLAELLIMMWAFCCQPSSFPHRFRSVQMRPYQGDIYESTIFFSCLF